MSKPKQSVESARRRVLVIDDERPMRAAFRRSLGADCDVETADNGRDALRRLRAGERFHAIVCDLDMPAMSGQELHAVLRDSDPALAERMIFITGDPTSPEARAFFDRIANPRFIKPLDMDVIASTISALDED